VTETLIFIVYVVPDYYPYNRFIVMNWPGTKYWKSKQLVYLLFSRTLIYLLMLLEDEST
jgi:hypothetical protein